MRNNTTVSTALAVGNDGGAVFAIRNAGESLTNKHALHRPSIRDMLRT